MEKMICVQQHFSSVLEEHTSKLEELNSKVDNMAIIEKESIQEMIREMQKSITDPLKHQLKLIMRKIDEKQNKLTRRTLGKTNVINIDTLIKTQSPYTHYLLMHTYIYVQKSEFTK